MMQVIGQQRAAANCTRNESEPELGCDGAIGEPLILGDNLIYQIIYSNVLYYPVMYLLPLASLAYLNVKLISALNAIRRRTATASTAASKLRQRKRRKDDHITQCVVAIVCVFIVCQTPALFNQIFWALFEPADRECGRFHFYYTKLSDVLVVVNSSCNFVIYCLFGATFRRIFLATVCSCCGYRLENEGGRAAVASAARTAAPTTELRVGVCESQSLSPRAPGKRRRWSAGDDADDVDEPEAALDGASFQG